MKLIKNLIWGSALLAIFLVFFFLILPDIKTGIEDRKTKKNSRRIEYVLSGKGIASQAKPIRAYLDPLKTRAGVVGKGDAKFVLESNPSIFFICNEKGDGNSDSEHMQEWWAMPAGNYLVYPYPENIQSIVFQWYQ